MLDEKTDDIIVVRLSMHIQKETLGNRGDEEVVVMLRKMLSANELFFRTHGFKDAADSIMIEFKDRIEKEFGFLLARRLIDDTGLDKSKGERKC